MAFFEEIDQRVNQSDDGILNLIRVRFRFTFGGVFVNEACELSEVKM